MDIEHEVDDGTGHAQRRRAEASAIPVYVTIHRIRRLVIAAIRDPYTLDQLRAPHIDLRVVRPLADRLYNADDPSIVYCLLANRVQFLRSQSDEALYQTVNVARAAVCELIATRVLHRFHEEHDDRPGLLLLANVLVSGFDPFDAAPPTVRREGRAVIQQERGGHEFRLTALKLAILSESKILIGSLACQRVVNAVYRGLVVYTPLSFVDILPDHYKDRPISLYEPRRASILNHRRLIVPRLRNMIELAHFTVLLCLYVLTMICRGDQDPGVLGVYEAAFAIFTAGWVLEQFAAIIEHGWEVHAQNLWSFLDLTFILIFGVYGVFRVTELWFNPEDYYGLPILCIAAPILLTRIAFNFMPDNIVFIALHAMMRDFMRLTFIAIWCFAGFLLGLGWLMRTTAADPEDGVPWSNDGPGTPAPAPQTQLASNNSASWVTIGKWLLWIWFGLDGTGIERTAEFHFILGPTLAVTFAFLGNTLFLTILVAILTNTFSKIISNEASEIQFRRAVLTFQGVKSDSIFAYPPPFNIVALFVMLPLKFIVGPAMFHHINVAVIKIINWPLLLLIALYERRRVWARSARSGRRWHFGLSPYGDIQAVFGAEPPGDVVDLLEKLDAVDDFVDHEVTGAGAGLSTDRQFDLQLLDPGKSSSTRRRKLSAGTVVV
ncbi:hypothetical protein B0T22DRAFT_377911 [Podospora appendiculata]|uniref:Calcium channel YVC1 n=1 Tax=Podospora appendiculata TaxID=314037 RepID=A0AAE0X7W0_9PEZI|nr:hypothetical protein B0T22DRAFT_377911 [Podospora appendiculata]